MGPRDGDTSRGSLAKKGYFDVPFHCSVCGVRGHVVYKDGSLPEAPEEAINDLTDQLVDVNGECEEQLVDGVHAY